MDPAKGRAAKSRAQQAVRKMFTKRVTEVMEGVKPADITPMEEKMMVASYEPDKRLG